MRGWLNLVAREFRYRKQHFKMNSSHPRLGLWASVVLSILSSPVDSLKSAQIYHPQRNSEKDFKIVGVLGSRYELPCTVDSSQGGIWQKKLAENIWINMAELCEERNNKRCRVEVGRGGGDQKGPKTLKLIFYKFRRSDLGVYSCGTSLDRLTEELRNDPNDYVIIEEEVDVRHEFPGGGVSNLATVGDEEPLHCELRRGNTSVEGAVYKVQWQIQGRWRDPNTLPTDKYSYAETPNDTTVTINDVTEEDAGWYTCALWDAQKFPIFTEERVVKSFEIRLRVRTRTEWLIPVVLIGGQVLLLFIFMILVEKTKWFPDGDNSSDCSMVSEEDDWGTEFDESKLKE